MNNMNELKFPCTIQDMSEDTGIPERTLRKYCEELGVKKFGKSFFIAKFAYGIIVKRDEWNSNKHKSKRKYGK